MHRQGRRPSAGPRQGRRRRPGGRERSAAAGQARAGPPTRAQGRWSPTATRSTDATSSLAGAINAISTLYKQNGTRGQQRPRSR
ncbi:hypothetical protein EAS64_28865 [Trebonia kvetii]|uniref:Uncharacterized protein n=1 Tax=Trebonia kvetii TaxID=2480626 RepID=A0A6P2BTG4_9ACTN|nr:hypothetical protein EAS64_28865 [Trebonia kvetii]